MACVHGASMSAAVLQFQFSGSLLLLGSCSDEGAADYTHLGGGRGTKTSSFIIFKYLLFFSSILY
jgi:hypothetical protein